MSNSQSLSRHQPQRNTSSSHRHHHVASTLQPKATDYPRLTMEPDITIEILISAWNATSETGIKPDHGFQRRRVLTREYIEKTRNLLSASCDLLEQPLNPNSNGESLAEEEAQRRFTNALKDGLSDRLVRAQGQYNALKFDLTGGLEDEELEVTNRAFQTVYGTVRGIRENSFLTRRFLNELVEPINGIILNIRQWYIDGVQDNGEEAQGTGGAAGVQQEQQEDAGQL